MRRKRKLDKNQDDVVNHRHKRRKLTTKLLYINDLNTSELDNAWIHLKGLDHAAIQLIIKQRVDNPFKSMDDLIQRINNHRSFHTQMKKEDIIGDSTMIIFKTRSEIESDRIYDTLLNIELLKDQATDTIKCIADMAVGLIKSCDNGKCPENIIYLNNHSYV